MGSVQSSVMAAVSLSCVYFIYVQIYCSHTLLRSNVLNGSLPSFLYLYIKYVTKAVTRRSGRLHPATTGGRDVVYAVLDCRLETPLLRRFCSAAGYGWDYPDTEYRDVPVCFPEILFRRLLLMVLTDEHFRLSPAGLSCVRQRLKTLQPIDELKKGPFMLQVRVQEYRQVDTGVEVDVGLSATSRTGCPVWESVLTLLSKKVPHKPFRSEPKNAHERRPDEPAPEHVKEIEVRVPRATGLQCVWFFCDYSPYRLLSLSARLFGSRSQSAPALWMLSVCLAEIEKHKGVGVLTAPVNVTAEFKEPLFVPSKVKIKFWERNGHQSSAQELVFYMQQRGSNTCHLMGLISSKHKYMKKQRKGNAAASLAFSSPPENSGVQVCTDYQSVAFVSSGNGHASENGSQHRRDRVTGPDCSGQMSAVPDVASNSRDLRCGMKGEGVRGNSTWMMDSSSRAYLGPEDNSTDPHETLTESSTLTFVDVHTLEESADSHSLHGLGRVYLKEFVLIDDDDDGDMSLREKTVTDLSVMDGKAADLVCGRFLSTSSGSLSESKEEFEAPDAPPAGDAEMACEKKRCCFCTVS